MGTSGVGNGLGRNLDQISNNISNVFKKLSSGKRINSAADDAAGLAIAEQLNNDAVVFKQASRNTSDAQSFTNIRDGVYDSLSQIGTRLAELSTQAANGTYSDDQRSAINTEFQQLTEEANRIVASTSFNGQPVFSGQSTTIQVGADASSDSQIQITDSGLAGTVAALTPLDISSQSHAQSALDSINAFVDSLSQSRSSLGAQQSRLEVANNNAQIQSDNARIAESRIRDANIAEETASLVSNRIRQDSTTSLAAQAGKLNAAIASRLLA